MPWNDNANPGPWGSPPGGDGQRPEGDGPPRREEPRRRPPPPGGPDPAELFRRARAEVERLLRGSGRQRIRPPVIAAILGVAVLVWLVTGFYTVQANQEGVVLQFGAYDRSEGPGLHYHLPSPIEEVELVSVTNQNRIVIGESPDESLMLTGDENIVDLSFAVQWHVADAKSYLFSVRDPDDAVKWVAESTMREVIGHSALIPILTTGRGSVQSQTLALMQRILDRYHAGVAIDAVQIQSANFPAEVVPANQDIARAGQDALSAINDANAYRNKVVNEARGSAAKIVQDAEGYREQTVREAQGQAARFNQVYVQYRRAPAVTRERIYIQTMQQVLSHTRKIIVDGKGATAPIILPPQAFQPSGQSSAPVANAAQTQGAPQ